MTVTTRHPSYPGDGRPVFVDDDGNGLPDHLGVRQALERLGWTREDFALRLTALLKRNVSRRALERYLGPRPRSRVPVEYLIVLQDALALPPCPFCGSGAVGRPLAEGEAVGFVACGLCQATGPENDPQGLKWSQRVK